MRGMVTVAVVFTFCKGNDEMTDGYRATGTEESPPGSPFSVLSLFKTPSNLANLISSAMKKEGEEREKDLEEKEEEVSDNSTLPTDSRNDSYESTSSSSSSSSSLSSPLTTFFASIASSSLSSSSSTAPEDDEGGVQFLPASSAQFGDLGNGSKLVDLFSDLSEYSVSATEVAPFAGAGAVALLALGALFAVPVAPALLRRTGAEGWSGLPSLSELFGWFRSSDPVAEAWADNYYQRYEHPGGEYGGEYYPGFDHSESGSVPKQYFEDGSHPHPGAPGPHAEAPNLHHDDAPPPRYQPIFALNRRQGTRRVSKDGYEYVNLDEINRIGEESVRIFGQLVQGMGEQDEPNFYRVGTNHVARRRLPQQHQDSHHDSSIFQHDPNPSFHYQSNDEVHEYPKVAYENQAYVENYEYPQNAQDQHYESQPHSQNTDEYQEKELHWYPQHDRDSNDALVHGSSDQSTSQHPYAQEIATSDVPHPYRKEEPQVFLSERRQGENSDQSSGLRRQPIKVSEFPYEFHKSD